jgi:DNA polymerase IV
MEPDNVSAWVRKILHLDLDAFFCAVEEQQSPGLVGRPFAVGGRPSERGVVSSCSYPARRLGIHSAMPMAQALKLCPNLVVLPPRIPLYSQVSNQVMQRLFDLTDQVERISIDEAFVDASDLPQTGERLALHLQTRIREELGLPCSLGVATNKLVAKIANDMGKSTARKKQAEHTAAGSGAPNAITIVPPGQEAEFLAPLPVEALWGVGPKTAARLAELGVSTIGDLAHLPPVELISRFGRTGADLAERANGIDDRPICTTHEVKSISQETTFARDIRDEVFLKRTLSELCFGVGGQLRKEQLCCQTVKLKIRWPDFQTLTRQVTLPLPTDRDEDIQTAALFLFRKIWHPRQAVRLLGVGASSLGPPVRQLMLWD